MVESDLGGELLEEEPLAELCKVRWECVGWRQFTLTPALSLEGEGGFLPLIGDM